MRSRRIAGFACVPLCVLLALLLVSCAQEKPPECRYGWFEDEVLLLLQSGDGKSLVTVAIPSEIVTGYQSYLAMVGQPVSLEQAMVDLCSIPSHGFFGGTSADLVQLRGLLDSLAIETGVSMTSVPTATQRIQALILYAKPLRKTAMVDTLGKLAGMDAVDGMLGELEQVTACAGYDAGDFITMDNTMDWERTHRWLTIWLQQVLASVQRSR